MYLHVKKYTPESYTLRASDILHRRLCSNPWHGIGTVLCTATTCFSASSRMCRTSGTNWRQIKYHQWCLRVCNAYLAANRNFGHCVWRVIRHDYESCVTIRFTLTPAKNPPLSLGVDWELEEFRRNVETLQENCQSKYDIHQRVCVCLNIPSVCHVCWFLCLFFPEFVGWCVSSCYTFNFTIQTRPFHFQSATQDSLCCNSHQNKRNRKTSTQSQTNNFNVSLMLFMVCLHSWPQSDFPLEHIRSSRWRSKVNPTVCLLSIQYKRFFLSQDGEKRVYEVSGVR